MTCQMKSLVIVKENTFLHIFHVVAPVPVPTSGQIPYLTVWQGVNRPAIICLVA